jgi:hypothetical protein
MGLIPPPPYPAMNQDVHNGRMHSRLTFLVYLNGGFSGGGTTFFLPGEQVREDVMLKDLCGAGVLRAKTSLCHERLLALGDHDCNVSPENVTCMIKYILFLSYSIIRVSYVVRRQGPGHMAARGVQPQCGAVLCFPHGDAQGSLVHEGSVVEPGGVKYIIRTDVLYATSPALATVVEGQAEKRE